MKIQQPNKRGIGARLVVIPYLIAKVIAIPFRLLNMATSRRGHSESTLCLEAGVRGWEIIEYQELYKSAVEYLPEASVVKFIVQPDEPYLKQLERLLAEKRPTHYGWSPRTGEQRWAAGLWESFRILILFLYYDVTPIAFLTDLPVRQWRTKTAIVTAYRGIVVTLMEPRTVRPIFPHRRLLGPHIMPFSMATLQRVEAIAAEPVVDSESKPAAVFAGALYEPRKSILEEVADLVAEQGETLVLMGRDLSGQRVSDEEYWRRMAHARMVITTAEQALDGRDWPWMSHLIYRYLEVLASGSLLIAPEVGGIRRFFTPGEHFISFRTTQEAAEKICHFAGQEEERKRIAQAGHDHAKALVQSRVFWSGIDMALRSSPLV